MSEVKLYNGDCLIEMAKIPDKSIDCIICDLPYYKVVDADFDNCWEDDKEYLMWVEKCILELKRIAKDNSNILLFTSRQYNRYICNILDKHFIENRIIIWSRKRGFNTTRGKTLASGYEPICWYSNGKNNIFNNIKIKPNSNRKEYTDGILKEGICLSDVWCDISALPHNSKEKVNHPTQKPILLMERLVSLFTNKGDTILDFCMGSGSTGVACVNLDRIFIGIELNKEYFDIAQNRIEETQNKQKKKLF